MRINDSRIFDVYVESLITEAKKKKKNLPPWLKEKKGNKEDKKVVKESHENLPPEVLNMTVKELLDRMQSVQPDLYSQVEAFLGIKDDVVTNVPPPPETPEIAP